MKKAAAQYTGDLATPIERRDVSISLLDDPHERDAQVQAEKQRIAAELEHRYVLLMEHYGVPTDRGIESMAMLAIELAREHVPGLRIGTATVAHRPQAWTSARKARLVADMVELMAVGKTKADAARMLIKREDYRALGGSAASLAKRYDEAKDDPLVGAVYSIAKSLPAAAFVTAIRGMTEKG
ncbi:hypothetical protein [Ancylobacter terrae]|uniref:hypothetical protein n=1 Tax=Ancylobacter sp. sgz301288 TaxID=3342077 RepID=UPI003859ACB6